MKGKIMPTTYSYRADSGRIYPITTKVSDFGYVSEIFGEDPHARTTFTGTASLSAATRSVHLYVRDELRNAGLAFGISPATARALAQQLMAAADAADA